MFRREPHVQSVQADRNGRIFVFAGPGARNGAGSVGAEGHRARMRQRLLKAGPDALADHEMLEMILFIALPRRDTKPIARELLARFRTFGGVLGAPADGTAGDRGYGRGRRSGTEAGASGGAANDATGTGDPADIFKLGPADRLSHGGNGLRTHRTVPGAIPR